MLKRDVWINLVTLLLLQPDPRGLGLIMKARTSFYRRFKSVHHNADRFPEIHTCTSRARGAIQKPEYEHIGVRGFCSSQPEMLP